MLRKLERLGMLRKVLIILAFIYFAAISSHFDFCGILSFRPTSSWHGEKQSSTRALQTAKGEMKWAIFTVPKPMQAGPAQIAAVYSWTQLSRRPENIYIIQASDVTDEEMAEWARMVPQAQIIKIKGMSNMTLRLDIVFERASRELVDAVVVINSDIVLFDDFTEALAFVSEQYPRFFMIGSRYDCLKELMVPEWSALNLTWLENLRNLTLRNGALHTYGGSDYYAWRPAVGEPTSVTAIGSRIPPFSIGRPHADNWMIDRAIEVGRVEVVDVTAAVTAVHLKHDYRHVVSADNQVQNSSKVDPPLFSKSFWSSLKGGDDGVILNKHLAFTCGNFANQEGTPLHAPWTLMLCETPSSGSFHCLRRRARPAACGCEHSAYFGRTMADPIKQGRLLVCGRKSAFKREAFPDEQTFPLLVRQQAGEDGVVILVGFNYGYQAMLLNSVRASHFDSLCNRGRHSHDEPHSFHLPPLLPRQGIFLFSCPFLSLSPPSLYFFIVSFLFSLHPFYSFSSSLPSIFCFSSDLDT